MIIGIDEVLDEQGALKEVLRLDSQRSNPAKMSYIISPTHPTGCQAPIGLRFGKEAPAEHLEVIGHCLKGLGRLRKVADGEKGHVLALWVPFARSSDVQTQAMALAHAAQRAVHDLLEGQTFFILPYSVSWNAQAQHLLHLGEEPDETVSLEEVRQALLPVEVFYRYGVVAKD